MSTPTVGAYCSGVLGPGSIQDHISDIQRSGLDTVILWSLHIGRTEIAGQKYGDLIFNDGTDLFVSQGAFNPNDKPEIQAWPGQLAQLKQSGSSVQKIYFSIGGDERFVKDFRSIEYMLQNGMEDALRANFAAMRTAFTVDGQCVIDGIDLDNEETVSADTITRFSTMLFLLGFEVSFCPFSDPENWAGYMSTLWHAGHKVSRWNLQAYSGGDGNLGRDSFPNWIAALESVVGKGNAGAWLAPGLAVQGANDSTPQQCPDSMQQSLAAVASDQLVGGFFWTYDWVVKNAQPCGDTVPTAADYVSAIQAGLTPRATVEPTAQQAR